MCVKIIKINVATTETLYYLCRINNQKLKQKRHDKRSNNKNAKKSRIRV